MIAALAMSLGSLAGCGDDGTTETGTSESGDTTSTSTSSTTAPATETDPTTGATSSMTSDTTAGSEEGTGTTTSMTSDTTAGSEEGTGTTTSMTSDTTEGGACEGLNEAECNADAGCMPINGAPIVMSGNGFCLQPLEFVECQVAIGCGDAITYACEADDTLPFEFLDTCIPDGWFECPAPGGALPPC